MQKKIGFTADEKTEVPSNPPRPVPIVIRAQKRTVTTLKVTTELGEVEVRKEEVE